MKKVHPNERTTLLLRHGDWEIIGVITAGAAMTKLTDDNVVGLDANGVMLPFEHWKNGEATAFPDAVYMTSAQHIWMIPSIAITTSNYSIQELDKKRQGPTTPNKDRLLEILGPVCQLCDRMFHKKLLTFEHIKPRCKGGLHHWDNVTLTCTFCNNQKADKYPCRTANGKILKGPPRPKHIPRMTNPKHWRPEWVSHIRKNQYGKMVINTIRKYHAKEHPQLLNVD
jgi:hypothetical protein